MNLMAVEDRPILFRVSYYMGTHKKGRVLYRYIVCENAGQATKLAEASFDEPISIIEVSSYARVDMVLDGCADIVSKRRV